MTYLAIQEHFQKHKTIDKYFKEQFPDYNSFVIPGFREAGQTRGWTIAGFALLSRSCIGIRKDHGMCNNSRIQAQILNFNSNRLLWINAYFPCDLHTVDFDDPEFVSVLTEKERIMDTAQYDVVLMSADLS